MFDFFQKRRTNREMDALVAGITSNMSNNYKDAAQDYLKRFEKRYLELEASGALDQRQTEHYGDLLSDFKERMKQFSHKDQKPYWT